MHTQCNSEALEFEANRHVARNKSIHYWSLLQNAESGMIFGWQR